MAKVLIISATSSNNLKLALKLQETLNELETESSILNLEDYTLPVFTPSEKEKGIQENAVKMLDIVKASESLIFCVPEYNGGVPPIVSNALAWISCAGDKDWRKGFNQKVTLITSHSAGHGMRLADALQLSLQHLGAVVLPRKILINDDLPYNEKSVKGVLSHFLKLL